VIFYPFLHDTIIDSKISMFKKFIRKVPLLHNLAKNVKGMLIRARFRSSKDYWEARYSGAGNSGTGSYGNVATFKANILNTFAINNGIKSVVEFGCGDGNQLNLFNFTAYKGLDVSKTIINACKDKFADLDNLEFELYTYSKESKALYAEKYDLALSLDVIYHLVEDEVYENYIDHLFSSSAKFVVIYSYNIDVKQSKESPHVRLRKFTGYVNQSHPNWKLTEIIKNEYPEESTCDFFIYKKGTST